VYLTDLCSCAAAASCVAGLLPAVNPPNEDELFEALSAASVQKAEELPLLVRTGEVAVGEVHTAQCPGG
jgi:hypothetical protein